MAPSITHRDVWNLGALYASLGINAAVSLGMIGYLARVLGTQGWGLILLTQAFGYWTAMLPEYGFTLSASRDIAQAKTASRQAQLASSVVWAKVALSALVIPVALVCYLAIPSFRQHPVFLLGGVAFGIAQGMDPIWLFQGIERQFLYGLIASTGRITTLLLVLLLVHGPGDGWLVMFLQSAGAIVVFTAGMIFLRFHLPPTKTSRTHVWGVLLGGWKVFQYRGAQGLTANSSVLILGMVSPPSVNAFGSADRIMRNWIGLLGPLASAGLPKIARLLGHDAKAARGTARLLLAVTFGFGVVSSSMLLIFTPQVVSLILGPGYGFVVPVLRVSAVALPLAALSNMLGVQGLLPLGLDATLVRITLAAGVMNAAGCALFGAMFGAMGAAVTVVAIEAGMVVSFTFVLRRTGGPDLNEGSTARAAMERL